MSPALAIRMGRQGRSRGRPGRLAPAGGGLSAVVLSARVVARASARRELLHALLDWAASARRQAGLRAANVYEDVEAEAAFGLVAEWDGEAALEAISARARSASCSGRWSCSRSRPG